MRYTRPLSVCSETRLSWSFLRTTPARKPRTECCCQSVTFMSAAIVAPVGARSIAMMRACLVSGPTDLDAERADRLRDPGRAVVRVERVAVFGLDLGLAIGGPLMLARRFSPHQLSPARQKHRQGRTPKRAVAASSHHSNALIKPESQSILSNIIAHTLQFLGLFARILEDSARLARCCSCGTLWVSPGGVDPPCEGSNPPAPARHSGFQRISFFSARKARQWRAFLTVESLRLRHFRTF